MQRKMMLAFLMLVPALSVSHGLADDSLLVSPRPIVDAALSPMCEHLCFVQLVGGRNVLKIKGLRTATPPHEVAQALYIRDAQFLDEARVVYAIGKGGIRLYDHRTRKNTFLANGRKPLCMGECMVYLQEGQLRVRDVGSGADRTLETGRGFVPCTWTDEGRFLACQDGSVWRISVDGKRKVFLKGSPYAPWYVDAALSPDRRSVLLVSDDTKADVGAGARSLWIMPARGGPARKLVVAPTAQWLDSARIGLARGNKLLAVEIATGAQTVVRELDGTVEAFACRNGKFAFAVKRTDEDGLYAGSVVYLIHWATAAPSASPAPGKFISHVEWEPKRVARDAPRPTLLYLAHEVAQPPKIDGVLDEPCWQRADTLSKFLAYQMAGRAADVQTHARLCFARDTIFVGLTCDEPDLRGLKADCTERDGYVWGDDCVEIWFDVRSSRRRSFHFLINPVGTVQDLCERHTLVRDPVAAKAGAKKTIVRSDVKWNARVRAAVSRGQDSWTVEAALPVKELGADRVVRGSLWGLNIARTRRSSGTLELSSWTGVFMKPIDRFGTIQMGESAYDIDVVSWGSLACGRNRVTLTIRNKTPHAQTVLVEAIAVSQKTEKRTVEVAAGPAATKRVELPYGLYGPGSPYRLSVTVREASSGRPVFTRQREGDIPEVLQLSIRDFELYIGEQKEVKAAFTVNVGGPDLRQCSLAFALVDNKDIVLRRGSIRQIRGPSGVATFAIGDVRQEGSYRIRAQLHDAGNERIATASADLNLTDPPF